MDCPSCGLTNPPGAATCDCGHNFEINEPSAKLGWSIDLEWRHKLAAFWLLTWPGLAGMFLLIPLVGRIVTGVTNSNQNAGIYFSLVMQFLIQALLVPRMVRKNYRSFRIGIVHEDGRITRSLTFNQSLRVWLWIFQPQLALSLIASVVVWWGTKLPPETLRLISSLSIWLRFLAVGPYAIGLAMKAKYRGFRLQGYGRA